MVSTILVLGATGNTGRLVVGQLLLQNQNVKAMVRSKERFHAVVEKIQNLSVIEETVLDMQDSDLDDAVRGCDAVVSCLGHNITFKGIYGQPRRLVADSVKTICESIQRTQPSKKVKVVLMGTDAAANPNGMDDPRSGGERLVVGCLRALMPPVKDNEEAARYLSKDVGEKHDYVEWVVVRPTDLIDGEVSEYSLTEKPVTGLFGDGEATRANVGHFISALITNDDAWKKWVYKMPVLVNNDPN